MVQCIIAFVEINLKGYVTKHISPTVTEESNGLEITTNDFLLIYQTPFARLFPIDGVGEIIMRYVCNLCYFLPYRPYRFSADFLNSLWLVLDYSIFL